MARVPLDLALVPVEEPLDPVADPDLCLVGVQPGDRGPRRLDVLQGGPQVHARIVASPSNRAGGSTVVPVSPGERRHMSLLWIILIVVLVLALLGFFGRSYW